jgi:hypothetical protein
VSNPCDRLEVGVTFDLVKGHYVAAVPDLPAPIVALSLTVLRKRIEAALLTDDVVITLSLDRAARRERDRRRQQAQLAR